MPKTPDDAADGKARAKAAEIVERLRREYPDAECALTHDNPLQLLIATILSAQCTDARVNMVTPALFARYPTAADYQASDREELETLIRSTGFYRNKAKSIRGAASKIATEFGGVVPRTMEELLTLPGVARKTANVVLGTAFGIADGFVVDTHVFRLSHRLGWVEAKSPEQVEKQLLALIPQTEWIELAHILIHHGRAVCTARAPRCEDCQVRELCPKLGVPAKKTEPVSANASARVPLSERIARARTTRRK